MLLDKNLNNKQLQVIPENSEKWMPSYPWRFSIMIEGQRHFYAGLPNKCETKASALKRAWHRAKWLKEGSYHSRYCNGGG